MARDGRMSLGQVLLLGLVCLALPLAHSDATPSEEQGDVLVSPIVNRELEASVVAHAWPSTPASILCEAHAYHEQEGPVFLDNLVKLVDPPELTLLTYERAHEMALQASPLQGSSLRLLEYSLALRAQSPQCELHRGLADETLRQSQAVAEDVFHVVYPMGKVLTDASDVASLCAQTTSSSTSQNVTEMLLPGEVLHCGDKKKCVNPNTVIIMYANVASPAFARAYQTFRDAQLPVVIRPVGAVGMASAASSTPTVLQGYGVRLDIRNVEYKVFDVDEGSKNSEEESQLVNLTAIRQSENPAPPNQFLAGVNLTALGVEAVPASLMADLWEAYYHQQLQSQIIPPVWQRRQLGLQAATAIASSKDPLETLQEVSQNLPSVASTLVHIPVSSELTMLANGVQEASRTFRPGTLYINGRAMAFDLPTFNVFELVNVLRTEQATLDGMKSKFSHLSPRAFKLLQSAWLMGTDFGQEKTPEDEDPEMAAMMGGKTKKPIRIDVARRGQQAVLYLNDIEKDAQYAQWPTSFQQMLMGLQYGMPPTVRRNLYTMLGVMDPLEDSNSLAVLLGSQLLQSQVPARIGILSVSLADMDACVAWLRQNQDGEIEACPVKPVFAVKEKSVSALKSLPASVQAIYRLMAHVQAEHPMYLMNYVQYFLSRLPPGGPELTMYDILHTHGSAMEAFQLQGTAEAEESALDLLQQEEPEGPSYGKALRFAIDKGLKPGMGFLNGRPIPSQEELSNFFGDEQNIVMEMIMMGEISEESRRSVYSRILTGDRVFKKYHRLLLGANDGKPQYVETDHSFGADAILRPESVPTSPEAHFVVDAFVDLDTTEGLSVASTFVKVMDNMSSKLEAESESVDIKIGYRLIPRFKTSVSSALCPLLTNAAAIGSDNLLIAMDLITTDVRDGNSGMTASSIVAKLNDVPNAVLESINESVSTPCELMQESATGLSSNFVVANGRHFDLEELSSLQDDIEMLLSLELSRSRAVTALFASDLAGSSISETVARVSGFLALEGGKRKRTDVAGAFQKMSDGQEAGDNHLFFSWKNGQTDTIQLEVTAVVDPISEAAQRVTPLLRVIRDQLGLTLNLILAPDIEINGDSDIALTSYYRFVGGFDRTADNDPPKAHFTDLPSIHVLTLKVDVPEPWNVQQTRAIQDTDNLRCDVQSGCSDAAHMEEINLSMHEHRQVTRVEYGLNSLLVFGQCYETSAVPPAGLQLVLARDIEFGLEKTTQEAEVEMDGSMSSKIGDAKRALTEYTDSLVMQTVGYWQVRANPGVWKLSIAQDSRGYSIFDMVDGSIKGGRMIVDPDVSPHSSKTIVMKDFVSRAELLAVKRRPGTEKDSLFFDESDSGDVAVEDEVINVFSLATGHLYERFLKIMMLSVTKRTSSKVKFWLFENFLSPTFKASAKLMANRIGCEVEFVTYKWPEWLRGQSEKQRIIWGYKILFLDVLFPLGVKKIIYVDADQVVRGDLKELWDMDLNGAPYGYTPFCTSRETTLGFQFWREGYWKSHLRGKPYHISALYVVDLKRFRRTLVGDKLRATYQQLSADPNSLANLDQDLPNYAQHSVPIFSLPQEWLWCESWCSDESKAAAKTIDLCNNPLHKEPKVSMAKRVISGSLFNESWIDLDAEVDGYDNEYRLSLETGLVF